MIQVLYAIFADIGRW